MIGIAMKQKRMDGEIKMTEVYVFAGSKVRGPKRLLASFHDRVFARSFAISTRVGVN